MSIAVPAFAAVGAPGAAASPQRAASSSAAATDPTVPAAAYAVGSRSMTVVDTSRGTPGSLLPLRLPKPSRTLPLLVLYPATGAATTTTPRSGAPVASGRFPVFEFSPGFTAKGSDYINLLQRIAAAGYVVAAPNFPLTSNGLASDITDFPNQPADVRFVLDKVLALDTKAGDPLAGHLATSAVAVGGHSLGGATSWAFVNTCCKDPRVKATLEMSSIQTPWPGTYDQGDTAVLMISGKKDPINTYPALSAIFAGLNGPRAFLPLPEDGHIGPVFGPGSDASLAAMVAYLDLELRGSTTRWTALDATLATINRGSIVVAGGLPPTN